MTPVILFRKDRDTVEECEEAKTHFQVYSCRSHIPPKSLVIARYSALPFYKELEDDLHFNGSVLINTYRQHSWIANFEYYEVVKDFTFKTWNVDEFILTEDTGPFVVKGATNSRKHSWNRTMFASTKQDAFRIERELSQDSLIGQQAIIFRKYTPLVTLEVGMFDLPFSNEWRFFCLGNKILTYGFYWNNMCDCPEKAKMTEEGLTFAQNMVNLVSKHANFFVLDIAEKQEGGWVLVEINDGQMSGLSDNKPEVLYPALKKYYESDNIGSIGKI